MSRKDAADEARAFVYEKMPKRIKNLVAAAKWDLQSGPYSKADMRDQGHANWPGYSKAIQQIEDWADKHLPSEITVDTFAGGVFEGAPEGFTDEETGEWVEPSWEDYVTFDRSAVRLAVFGDLVRYGGM